MNIFFLHRDPKQSAKYYYNRHCVKIILEIAQMLYTALWMSNSDDAWVTAHFDALQLKPYKKTHYNHPTSKWVRQTRNNYLYACRMGLELCYMYTQRYKKVHKSQQRIEWLLANVPDKFETFEIQAYLATQNLPDGCTPIPLAMPDKYHMPDAIQAYRTYYIYDKQHIAQDVFAYNYLCTTWNIHSVIDLTLD